MSQLYVIRGSLTRKVDNTSSSMSGDLCSALVPALTLAPVT
ncbi:MAG: hypothetical protein ACRDPY_14400 [Streptosporangiaceae bacterium]